MRIASITWNARGVTIRYLMIFYYIVAIVVVKEKNPL
jgi:hypothetical protein